MSQSTNQPIVQYQFVVIPVKAEKPHNVSHSVNVIISCQTKYMHHPATPMQFLRFSFFPHCLADSTAATVNSSNVVAVVSVYPARLPLYIASPVFAS
jgi:hypothetical protein